MAPVAIRCGRPPENLPISPRRTAALPGLRARLAIGSRHGSSNGSPGGSRRRSRGGSSARCPVRGTMAVDDGGCGLSRVSDISRRTEVESQGRAVSEEACAPSALPLARVSFGCGFAKPPSAVGRGPTGSHRAPRDLARVVSRFVSSAVCPRSWRASCTRIPANFGLLDCGSPPYLAFWNAYRQEASRRVTSVVDGESGVPPDLDNSREQELRGQAGMAAQAAPRPLYLDCLARPCRPPGLRPSPIRGDRRVSPVREGDFATPRG